MPPTGNNQVERASPPFAAFYSPDEWIARLGDARPRTTVTIGNFDGVHLGHQRIIRGVIDRSRDTATQSMVLTFFPHPARILRPEQAPPLLMTLAQRLDSFRKSGLDAALVLRFDAELAKVTAEDFVRKFLVDTLHARTVMVGSNFRFGHKQAGNVKLLEELGRRWDFEVQVVPPVIQDGIVVSSTAVRCAVREGRMEDGYEVVSGYRHPGRGTGCVLSDFDPRGAFILSDSSIPINFVYRDPGDAVLHGKPVGQHDRDGGVSDACPPSEAQHVRAGAR